MPVTYRLDGSAHVVLATAHGVVTDDEFLEYATTMVNDPTIDPGVDQLIDLRGVDANVAHLVGLIVDGNLDGITVNHLQHLG